MQLKIFMVTFLSTLIMGCSQDNSEITPQNPNIKPDRPINKSQALAGKDYIAHMNDGDATFNKEVLDNLWQSWEPSEKEGFEDLSEKERQEKIYEYYGMVPNPSAEGVPMGFNPDANGNWVVTCNSCHSGSLMGKTVVGIGNTAFDQSLLFEHIYTTRLILIEQGKELPELGKPFPFQAPDNISKLGNNAFHDTGMLFSYRDKDINLLETPIDFGKFNSIPVDVPAWWNVKKKFRLYMGNVSKHSHRSLMQFFIGFFSTTKASLESLEDHFVNVTQYIDTLSAKELVGQFPGEINHDLAKDGKKLFVNTCSRCHGTYDANYTYPEKTVRFKNLKTDNAIAKEYKADFIKHVNSSWFNYYGKTGNKIYSYGTGLVAPPLDGIWSTAPYFHNGSVPNLKQVLGLEERSKVWRVVDNDGYDLLRVGLLINTVDEIPGDAPRRIKRSYYDTRRYGHGNGGHDYPEELSMQEKRAVLEYLKTL